MANGIKVALTIRDNSSGSYRTIPVLPEKLSYDSGAKKVETITVLDLGTVDIPTGVDLASLSWESFFPAAYDPAYCATNDIQTPLYWTDLFTAWKLLGTSLQVVCPAAGINATMYVESIPCEFGAGPDGDIDYSVKFKQLKTVAPRQLTVGVVATPVATKAASERPAAPAVATSGTYTVKKGDTLTFIAKNLGIKDWWAGLYVPNRAVIGTNPNMIYPGQVYTYVRS